MYNKSNNFGNARIPIRILNSNHVSDESKLFILLVVFHRNKLISDHSLKDLLGNLKAGKLNRRVGTFHCKLNNVWYNDESILNIYIDVLSNVRGETDIPMKDFLQYVNRYLNKPRNYCIDFIIGNYIIPFVNSYAMNHYNCSDYERDEVIRFMRLFNISSTLTTENYVSYDKFQTTGYCCYDCDGSYKQYKRSQYNTYIWDNVRKDIKAEFKKYFDGIRDESYLKNPNPVDLLQP